MVIKKQLEVINILGVHARAAAKIVAIAGRFNAKVILEKDGLQADATSILDILIMASRQGTVLTVTAEGDDAEEVMDELESLFKIGFEER